MKTVSIFIVLEMHMKNRLSVDYFYSKIIVEEIKLSALVHFHSVISLALVVNSEYETKGLCTLGWEPGNQCLGTGTVWCFVYILST